MPHANGFVLTSNRDEKVYRETLEPQKYEVDGMTICYPKDLLAGGSWIAMNNRGRVLCLLNGAFIPHSKNDYHTQSRGNVLLEVARSEEEPDQLFSATALANVQPFTLICIDFNGQAISSFSEFIWDGQDRHKRNPDISQPYVWSSVTLYSEPNRKERKRWFHEFLNEKKMKPSASDMMQFHRGKHSKDKALNVIMEREGGLKTVSITQIIQDGNALEMHYADLLKHSSHSVRL